MISVNTRPSQRRLWRIRPRTTLFAIGAILLVGFAADRAWIRGNGIVAGELTAISPILQARLKHLYVKCLDHVVRGQRLAEFENEMTVQSAAQQLQQLELQLTQARVNIEIAQREADAAQKLVEAQAALFQQQTAVLKAEDELMKKNYVALLVWEQAKASVAQAEAETRAAEFVYQTKLADKKEAELSVEVLKQRIASFNDSPELTGRFGLIAPTEGMVTECTAQPGDVIAANTPIFQIFNPLNTYAVVFFDPSDLPRLAVGQAFELKIGGLNEPITAKLTGFFPELSALPSSLTRYFWQQEMWSQYVPARLDFVDVTAAQRSRIFAWAQLSASVSQGWSGVAAGPSVSWQWVQQHLDGAWQFITTSFAKQPVDQ
jgi:multidrug resistance efflux pump